MCGIAGLLALDGRPVQGADVRRMCAAMLHRGPDGEGYHVGPGVGLGMRRLSIIDLVTGDQPATNEDRTVWVVFNGEIYNFRELRRDLEARGHVFRTGSDTESIVHAYEEWGEECVQALRGMFAFAVWDEKRRRLLVARDRLGIKPLYYLEADGRLLFASELKALLALPEVERRLNWSALIHLLAFLTTPRTESIVAGVRKLPPGHVLTATAGGGVRVAPYWDVAYAPDHTRSEASLVGELRALLEEAVRLHLVSDVPLGAFLSGGIDSSAVVASMARLCREPVRTFTIGFRDPEFSEAPYARQVAQAFGTDHHELIVEPEVVGILEDLTYHLDEPFGDSSAVPTYMVSKLAAQHVKVVLSGDGGDELFAGYDRYVVESRERAFRFVPAPLRRGIRRLITLLPTGVRGRNRLRHLLLPEGERYLDAVTLFRHADQERLLRPEVFELAGGVDPWAELLAPLTACRGHWLSPLQRQDLRYYLPLDILTKVDRMTMAHSLEARPPLLDHRLVEFSARVPPALLMRNGQTKWLLKQAMRGILPDSVIDRPKRGFAIPLGRWFRGDLRGFVHDVLLSSDSRTRGIFDPDVVEGLLCRRHDRALDLELWTLLSVELWSRRFLGARTARAAA